MYDPVRMEQLGLWGYDEDGQAAPAGKRIVYILDAGDFVKIGQTARSADDRIPELQTGNPQPITLYGSFVVSNDEDDRDFHRRFAMYHYRGEWFRKSPELMAAIDRLLAQRQPIDRTINPIDFNIPASAGTDQIVKFSCPVCCEWLWFGVHVERADPGGCACASCYCHRCRSKVPILFRS